MPQWLMFQFGTIERSQNDYRPRPYPVGPDPEMKAGQVFHLRLSPKDIVGCVRVCEKVGIVLTGASLARHVSYAIRVLLESARQSGAIPPEEDPFTSFAQVRARFTFPQAQKLAAFNMIESSEIAAEIADEPITFTDAANKLTAEPHERTVKEVRLDRLQQELTELYALHKADPLNPRDEEIAAKLMEIANESERGNAQPDHE